MSNFNITNFKTIKRLLITSNDGDIFSYDYKNEKIVDLILKYIKKYDNIDNNIIKKLEKKI